MASTTPRWQLGLGCSVVIGVAAILGLGLYWFWTLFSGLQKEVAASLVTATGAVFVALASLLGGRYLEARRDQLQRLREKKAGLYEEFMSSVLGTYFLGEADQATKDQRLKEYFSRMVPAFITWADDRVIVEWRFFREALPKQTTEGTIQVELLLAFERLLLAMRKDLGHANRGIQIGDVLAVWVNDVQQVFGVRKR